MINKRRSFIVGIKSTSLLKKEKFFLTKYKPWGIILFARNLRNVHQIKKLTREIKFLFKDSKYPILIDQEGGRINRLSNLLDTSTFTANFFGKLYKNNKKKFVVYYSIYIKQISELLSELGININTVPVLDVKRKKSSLIIGDRSFSQYPKIVSKIGDFCIEHFSKHKIATVIKHIPGHGLAKVDSHNSTPTVTVKSKLLFKNDFNVFKKKKTFFQ